MSKRRGCCPRSTTPRRRPPSAPYVVWLRLSKAEVWSPVRTHAMNGDAVLLNITRRDSLERKHGFSLVSFAASSAGFRSQAKAHDRPSLPAETQLTGGSPAGQAWMVRGRHDWYTEQGHARLNPGISDHERIVPHGPKSTLGRLLQKPVDVPGLPARVLPAGWLRAPYRGP